MSITFFSFPSADIFRFCRAPLRTSVAEADENLKGTEMSTGRLSDLSAAFTPIQRAAA